MQTLMKFFGLAAANVKSAAQQKAGKKDGGFTAIELFVVIIVGLGIFIYAAANIDKLFGDSSALEDTRNLQQIAIESQKLKGTEGYGSGSLTEALIKIGGVPKTLKTTGSEIKTTWKGGNITVTGQGDKYAIKYTAVPKKQCADVFSKIGAMGLFETVKINSKELKLMVPGSASGASASPGQIAAACDADANTVTLTSDN